MRSVLRLAAIVAVVAADRQYLHKIRSSESNITTWTVNTSKYSSDVQCRANFQYYEGWCVNTSYPTATAYSYQDAVNYCSNVGVHAPSIHSQDDLDFWSSAVKVLSPNHFWLDASCPIAGQPNVWLDGTPTDFYGPGNVLQSCVTNSGFHMHVDGFAKYGYTESGAPALCAYDTRSPVDVTSDYCSCNPNTVYLDIVFVVDTSDDMTRNIVGDAAATIQSTLYGLTFGTGPFQSNVAALAFAESVQVVRDFGGFRSTKDISSFTLPYLGGNSDKMADAIKQASSMIYANGRDFSRAVIALLSDSFDQRHSTDIQEAAKAFKDDGGIFISIDYSAGLGIQGFEDIASPGFYINDTSTNPDLDADVLYALCDANCFCKDGLSPYTVVNERGRVLPNGCFHVSGFSAVYQAAEDNCQDLKGFVATVHDDDKSLFLLSLFPVKSRYWIGLRQNGTKLEWADGSNDKVTNWAPNNPVAGQECVYSQQQSGFNSPWFSAPCTDPLKNSMPYSCQLRPCGSDYDCFA